MREICTYDDVRLMIDNQWRDGANGDRLPVTDPANGETIGHLAKASVSDLEEAVESASRGFRVWSGTSAFERSKLLRRAGELVRQRVDRLSWLMTREQGKPLAEARAEVLAAADVIDWFAEESRRTYGQQIPSRSPSVSQMALKVPVGIVAAFAPWNFPVNQIVRKLAAALAAGCSIIIKAPEETPASPAGLIQAFIDAGIPEGVISLVFGNPAEISGHLIPHPLVRKISFTGSTAVGKSLASLAGAHMKRATMELGGHAPAIVLEGADVDHAARVLAFSKYRNAGQICISPTRLLIVDRLYDAFVDKFTAAANAVVTGNGLLPDVTMGPLANERRIGAMETLVADAVAAGATLATGGQRIDNRGNFFTPTVLLDVPVSARIMNEEAFGPVAIINRVSGVEDAIREANRLPFGLASYGFAASVRDVHALTTGIEAGMISVNHNGLALPEVPFGGIKESGYGNEGGSEALDAYLTTRFVSLAT